MSVPSSQPCCGCTIIACIFLTCYLLFSIVTVAPLRAQSSNDPFKSLMASGKSLYDQGKYVEAEAVFQEAVRLKSRSGEARYWLGVTHFEIGDDKEAAKQLRIAIRHDRKNPDGHLALGRTYMRMKNRMVDARKSLKNALRYDPEHTEVHYTLGISYMAQSKRDPVSPLYVMQARRAFTRAATTNPKHPDAYYQLGLSYENPSRDYKRALSLFYRQLMIKPDHRDAIYHLERCSYLLNNYQGGIDLLNQLVEVHGEKVPDHVKTLIYKLEATMHQSQEPFDLTEKAYKDYLGKVDPEEREYYTELVYVVSEEEYEQYAKNDTEGGKAEFRRRFWASRDPKPATVVNERLVEHYRRVMYAREHFSNGQQPWDRRGDIYIRYGTPDDQQRFIMQTGENPMKYYRPTGNARIDAIRERNFMWRYRLKIGASGTNWSDPTARQTRDPEASSYLPELDGGRFFGTDHYAIRAKTQALGYLAESWVYLEHDLELFFVDQIGVGKYDYPLGVHETNITEAVIQNRYNPRKIADALIEKIPESYDYDYGGAPLQFLYDIVSYKGEEGRADVEVAYMVPAVQLETVKDGRGMRTWFDSHIVLQDGDYNRVAQTSRRIGPIDRPLVSGSENDVGIEIHTGVMDLDVPAGNYRAVIEVRDEATRRIGIFEQDYPVPEYTGNTLMMSDIKLAVSISPAETSDGPFVRNGLRIEPNPARLYQRTDPVHFYYEIYNLTRDASGRTSYQVELEVKIKDRRRHIFWRILKSIDRLVRRIDNEQSVLMVFENEGNRPDEYSYTSIDTGASPTGTYEMSVRVTDMHSGQTAVRTKVFVLANDRVAEFNSDT